MEVHQMRPLHRHSLYHCFDNAWIVYGFFSLENRIFYPLKRTFDRQADGGTNGWTDERTDTWSHGDMESDRKTLSA